MNNSIYKVFKYRTDPKAIFELFKNNHMPFLLESSADIKSMGRYSFLGSDPFLTFNSSVSDKPVLHALRDLLRRYELKDSRKSIPLLCGAVGFFSYDLGFSFEKIKRINKSDPTIPDAIFGFYDSIIGYDHYKKEIFIFSSGFPEQGALRVKRAKKRFDEIVGRLKEIEATLVKPSVSKQLFKARLSSNFSKKNYETAVRRAQRYISKGDIYQVNIAQKFSSEFQGDDWQLYKRLVKNFPVSFSAFFSAKGGSASGGEAEDFTIISASPERFLSFDGKNVSTRPMKGTRKRTSSYLENVKLKGELVQSAKEKAELLMIVDLERNDLGRVCDYGSVKVRHLREIELYKSVFQATAEVSGVLHKNKDRLDLIKACFPGGSVTGCPKIRAMEIIEELEPVARSIYTGSLGFLSFHNTMELNVLIRTFLKKKNEISFHVGSGIVADSKPRDEYEETLIKAGVLMKALAGDSR